MAKLQVIEQNLGLSGQVGAVRIDPSLGREASSAKIRSLQALSGVGKTIQRSTEKFQEEQALEAKLAAKLSEKSAKKLQESQERAAKEAAKLAEKFQKSQDFSASSTAETKANSAFESFLIDNQNRSDFENVLPEYDIQSKQLIDQLLQDKRLSNDGRQVLTLKLNAMREGSRLKVRSQLKQDQMQLSTSEFKVNSDRKLEADATVEELLNFYQEAENNNVISKAKNLLLASNAVNQVEYRDTKLEIQEDPSNAEAILADSVSLTDRNIEDLQRYGVQQDNAQIKEMTEDLDNQLADPDRSDAEKMEDIDLAEPTIGKQESELRRKNIRNAEIKVTSEVNQSKMLSIELDAEEGIISDSQAKDKLIAMKGAITSEDQDKFVQNIKNINNDVEDSQKEIVAQQNAIRKAGHDILRALKKGNVFFDQKFSKTGVNITQRTRVLEQLELIEAAPVAGEDVPDFFEFRIPGFGRDFTEEEEAEGRIILNRNLEELRQKNNREFIDAENSFVLWLKDNPKATPQDARNFMQQTLKLPLQQLSITNSIMNTR